MNIETKYNLGDNVWFMRNNVAVSGEIISIRTHSNGAKLFDQAMITIHYYISLSNGESVDLLESRLFPDKPSLLTSL